MLQRWQMPDGCATNGHGWGYSNIGYHFAVRLMERAAPDAPADVVLKRRVFYTACVGDARLAGTSTDLIGFEMGGHRATIRLGLPMAC